MNNETTGQRIQRLRLGLTMTQQQIADAIGVPVSSFRNWEIDYREPEVRTAIKLAAALGVTVEYLFDTEPVERGERSPRPAGPTKRPPPPPKRPRGRPRKETTE